MNPFSAIGLVGNIVQSVDFGFKPVASTYKIPTQPKVLPTVTSTRDYFQQLVGIMYRTWPLRVRRSNYRCDQLFLYISPDGFLYYASEYELDTGRFAT